MSQLFEKLPGWLKRDKKSKKVSPSTKSIPALASANTHDTPIAPTSKSDQTTGSTDQKDERKASNGRKEEFLECGVTALNFLKEISEASGLLAPLKAACGATTAILETIQAMDNNTEGWKSMLERIRRHHQTFEEQLGLVKTENAQADASSALLAPIKAYAKELGELLKELMRESGISEDNVPAESKFQALKTLMMRYGTVKLEAGRISDYGDRLDDAMKQFNTVMMMTVGVEVVTIGRDVVSMSRKVDQIEAHLLHSPEPVANNEILLKPRPSLAQNFVGREDILEKMRKTHVTDRSPNLNMPVITVLSGLGGSGKTQIALKFALEIEKLDPMVPVFFLNADSEESLKEDYENLIRSLGREHHSKFHKDALTWLATKLKNWLLILDNADNPDLPLFSYIPKSPSGNVIITTRNANHATLAPNNTHPVEGLSEVESVALLLNSSGYEHTESNQALAVEIVRELGNLPLALAQAAGYLFVNKCLSRYLGIYRKSTVKILTSFTSQRAEDYRPPVARTIQMSLDHLPQEGQDLMRLLAHLDPMSIPHSIIAKAAERQFEHVTWTGNSELNVETLEHAEALRAIFFKDGEWSDFDFNELVAQCLQYSLLQIRTQGEDNFYSMHVLVRSYLKASSTLIQSRRPGQLVVRLLGSSVTIGSHYQFLAFNRILLPHLRLIRLEDVVEAGDYLGFGRVVYEMGDWELAITHAEKCVAMWRASLGEEHVKTLRAMMDLATFYRSLERNTEALELDEQVLGLSRKLFGPESSETLTAIHNLARSYRHVGRKEEAMEMEEQLLEMHKNILGPENPTTQATMINLAKSYSGMGRSQDAMKLEEQVLEERMKALGPEHPNTIRSMKNLAISYTEVGRYAEAMGLEEQVLELRTKVLGLEHPGTADAMWNLACSLENLELTERQLDLLRIAVPAHEKAYGTDHWKTIRISSALKELLSELSEQEDVATS